MDAQDPMRQRLKKLRDEYAAGVKAMADVQKKQEELHAVLLRISGAIQVLEELLQDGKPPSSSEPESS